MKHLVSIGMAAIGVALGVVVGMKVYDKFVK